MSTAKHPDRQPRLGGVNLQIRRRVRHRSDIVSDHTDPRRLASVGLVIALAVAACASSTVSPSPPTGTSLPPRPSASASTPSPRQTSTSSPRQSASAAIASPVPTASPPPNATPRPTTAGSCASFVLASLTEPQRIGQLFAVGLADDRFDTSARDAIRTAHIGSWWFTRTTSAGRAAIRKISDAIQAQASTEATGGVRSFVAANQEGGRIQALAGPGFDTIPSALIQGSWSTDTLRTRAARWGRQLAAAGVNLDFAPVADVVPPGTAADNAPIGQLEREYGSEPSAVASHVAAFIAGMSAAGVTTTAKHFPGLGRVAENTDFSAGVSDTVTTSDDPYLEPFRRAVDVGVPAVMVSLATYERIQPGRIAAFSWPIIGGILEGELDFGGIVMSDSLSAEAVSSVPVGTRAVRFLDEGGDMIVVRPVDMALEMAGAVAGQVNQDDWFRRRVDNAALHVLRAKEAAGLLPCGG